MFNDSLVVYNTQCSSQHVPSLLPIIRLPHPSTPPPFCNPRFGSWSPESLTVCLPLWFLPIQFSLPSPVVLVQPLWKTVWSFLKMLKIELPYDPAIALLGIYPKDTKIVIRRVTCTPMFMAAISTIAKLWKEPRCPSVDEWIKKMWYIHTMEYYSAIRKMKSYHLQQCGWK